MRTTLISAALGAALAILVGGISSRPSVFRVERGATIAAFKADVLDHIVDFHKWVLWSPYEGKDLKMNKTFSGSLSGEGAIYEWSGNSQVGAGRMEIQDVQDGTVVRILLEMFRPVRTKSNVTFTLATPSEGKTRCSWSMESVQGFVGKAVGLFLDMDRLIGADFETGLANLKKLLE